MNYNNFSFINLRVDPLCFHCRNFDFKSAEDAVLVKTKNLTFG